MTNPHVDVLTEEFEKVIESAWRSSSAIHQAGYKEPNHVARFIHGAPEGIASAIASVPGVASATVQGTFCHAKPCALWQSPDGDNERRELADLLFIVSVIDQDDERGERALLVQTKMGPKDSISWPPCEALTIQGMEQRQLYADLPRFWLELDGRPTKRKMREEDWQDTLAAYMTKRKAPPPYDIQELPSPHPGGLVYVAVDSDRNRVALPRSKLHPWLAENGRPKQPPDDVAAFDIPFSRAIAELVAEEDPRFGVRTEIGRGPSDWSRLINDLNVWAEEHFDATFWHGDVMPPFKGAPSKNVFHNVQTAHNKAQAFVVGDKQLLTLATIAFCGTPYYSPDWFWTRLGRRRWPSRNLRRIRSGGQGNGGDFGWPEGLEEDGPGGFGAINVQIEIAPGG